jgi:hypothetical protein
LFVNLAAHFVADDAAGGLCLSLMYIAAAGILWVLLGKGRLVQSHADRVLKAVSVV